MLKQKRKRLLYVIFVIGILIIAISFYHSLSNDTQRKAGFLNGYIQAQQLKKFSSYSSTPGWASDVGSAGYGSYYKSTMSPSTIKDSLRDYLKSNGYWVKTAFVKPECSYNSKEYCSARKPTNSGSPFWAINAGNDKLLIVVTITDKSYEDESSGEKPNPAGYTVLHFNFQKPGTNPNWY